MIYLNFEQVKEAHDLALKLSGGGNVDILNPGQIDSVLSHIQNDDYYPEFVDKVTHLFFCLCKFHPFMDGNKRTALSASAYFLLLNGYEENFDDFVLKMRDVVIDVATNKINKEELKTIIKKLLQNWFMRLWTNF